MGKKQDLTGSKASIEKKDYRKRMPVSRASSLEFRINYESRSSLSACVHFSPNCGPVLPCLIARSAITAEMAATAASIR